MIFAVENIMDCFAEAQDMMRAHYNEVGCNNEYAPLEPWYEAYKMLEDSGSIVMVSARDEDGVLRGYFVATLNNGLHYKSTLTAMVDVFYIDEQYRNSRNGYNMIKFAVDECRARGVVRMNIGCKVKHDVGPLFVRLGFSPIETIYSQILNKGV